MHTGTIRGAVVAAAVVAAAAGVSVISSVAAGSSNASSFVPITPCRLFDTRPAADNIGPRAIPLGAGDVFTVDTWGTNGNCTIPTGATALSLNVVAIGPTASSYLTVYPGGNARPTASSLNWTAGQAPTPNAVTAALNGTGQLSFYNLAGSVNIAADVVGYYEPSTSGPAGATGPAGPQGAPGVDPANIIWVAASGGDFTTVSAALASITDNDATHRYVIKLAPGTYTESAGIDMKDYVDIEGSGSSSVIASTGAATSGTTVRFNGALHSELRDLAVTNAGGEAVLVSATTGSGDVRLTRLRLSASGGSLSRALLLDNGRALVADVTMAADGGTTTTIGFSANNGSIVTVRGSSATASSSSSAGCYAAIANASTVTMIDVDATASGCDGGTIAVLLQSSASATLDQVRATASQPTGNARSVHIETSASAVIDRLNAVVPSDSGYALSLVSSTVLVRDSVLLSAGSNISIIRSGGTAKAIDVVLGGNTIGMTGDCTNAMTTGYAAYTCS